MYVCFTKRCFLRAVRSPQFDSARPCVWCKLTRSGSYNLPQSLLENSPVQQLPRTNGQKPAQADVFLQLLFRPFLLLVLQQECPQEVTVPWETVTRLGINKSKPDCTPHLHIKHHIHARAQSVLTTHSEPPETDCRCQAHLRVPAGLSLGLVPLRRLLTRNPKSFVPV